MSKKKVSDEVLVELAKAVSDGWREVRTRSDSDGVNKDFIDGYMGSVVLWVSKRLSAKVKRFDPDKFVAACDPTTAFTVKSVKRPRKGEVRANVVTSLKPAKK